MMCTVNVMATLEEHSIYVEEFSNPDSLLWAAEGEEPGPVARQANRYMRRHPEHPARAVYLHVQPALPPQLLHKVIKAAFGLFCEMILAHARKIGKERGET